MHGPALSEAALVLRRLDALAGCSECDGEITRRFLTPAHAEAVTLVRGWMEQAGLSTRLDPSGTLVGSTPQAASGGPVLLLGSHIDTVRRAGRFDGCLGVATAIAVAARRMDLPYALEIRAFGDEEGVRFPATLTGAHVAAGTFDPDRLAMRDQDGISLAEALRAFGLDPQALTGGADLATDAFAYLEVHIEQGPCLEQAGIPLGIVTAIAGAARFEVSVTGRAGHAGTVPMGLRQDALAAAAHMILAVRDNARARADVVATVGRLAVSPNAPNVIPGACVFSIDVRSAQDESREAAEAAMLTALRDVARDHGVELAITATHRAPAVACDPRLQATLAASVAALGLKVIYLPSGAGHDAMALAARCPVGMLFVRCAGGISHHPDESVTEADVQAAIEALAHALRMLAPDQFTGRQPGDRTN
jgi:allantoate deiminase